MNKNELIKTLRRATIFLQIVTAKDAPDQYIETLPTMSVASEINF